jgi:hypothetical protein
VFAEAGRSVEFCALKTPADRPARPARGSLAFFAHQHRGGWGDGTINAVAGASGGPDQGQLCAFVLPQVLNYFRRATAFPGHRSRRASGASVALSG